MLSFPTIFRVEEESSVLNKVSISVMWPSLPIVCWVALAFKSCLDVSASLCCLLIMLFVVSISPKFTTKNTFKWSTWWCLASSSPPWVFKKLPICFCLTWSRLTRLKSSFVPDQKFCPRAIVCRGALLLITSLGHFCCSLG